MKVSIVVPCYNSSSYIRQCINSILSQCYSNLELICVDDCSTDSTWNILKEYASQDTRVHILKTEKNTGSANYPIDYGVSKAESAWVILVGHDDYLEHDYISKLVSRQKDTNASIVLARMMVKHADSTNDFSIPSMDFNMDQVLSGREAVMLTIGEWKIGANGGLINKKIWQTRTKYLSRDFVHMNADEYATREILLMANSVAFVDAHYYYRKHGENITANNKRSYEALKTDMELVNLFRRAFGKKSNEYKKVVTVFISAIASHMRRLNSNNENFISSLNIIKKAHKLLNPIDILSSHVSIKRKLITLMPFFIYRRLMK